MILFNPGSLVVYGTLVAFLTKPTCQHPSTKLTKRMIRLTVDQGGGAKSTANMAKESGKISELNTAGRDSGLSFQTANGLGIEEKKIYNHGSLKVPKNAETDRGISLLQFRAVATSKYLIDQSSMDEFIDHFLAKTYSNEFKEQKFKMVDLIAEHIKQIEDWRSIASLKRPLAEEGFLRSLSAKATTDDPNLMMTAQDYVNLLKGVIEFKKELKDQFAKFPEKILGEKWRSIYHDTVNLDRKALLSEFSEWTETKFGKVSYHSPVNGEMVEKLAPIVNDIDLVDHIKAIDPKLSPQHVKEFTDFLFKGGADSNFNFDGVPWISQDIVKQLKDWKKFTFEKNSRPHAALKKTGSMVTAQEASSKPPTRSLLKHIKKILANIFGKLMQYLRGKKMG